MIPLRLTAALLLATSPALAQPSFGIAPTAACVETAADPETCIGRAADACAAAIGYATAGLSFCYGGERDWWDARLNATYRILVAAAQAMDADAASRPGTPIPVEEALRDMQRAWIVFRDATCTYEAAQFQGGTGQGPAGTFCQMRLTAEQAIYLDGQRPR